MNDLEQRSSRYNQWNDRLTVYAEVDYVIVTTHRHSPSPVVIHSINEMLLCIVNSDIVQSVRRLLSQCNKHRFCSYVREIKVTEHRMCSSKRVGRSCFLGGQACRLDQSVEWHIDVYDTDRDEKTSNKLVEWPAERSTGYHRQQWLIHSSSRLLFNGSLLERSTPLCTASGNGHIVPCTGCLLYTSDAADE